MTCPNAPSDVFARQFRLELPNWPIKERTWADLKISSCIKTVECRVTSHETRNRIIDSDKRKTDRTYPQALASTIPPASVNVDEISSRSKVALICSLPGVMKKSVAGLSPAADACLTKFCARAIS